MITKNFKALCAGMLQSNGSSTCESLIPITRYDGNQYYLQARFSNFPNSITSSVAFNNSGTGIKVGSGSTAPTSNDYNLESLITSGLQASSPTIIYGIDNDDNFYKELAFILTNTTSSDITVQEIGYFALVYANSTRGSTGKSTCVIMLDRTVLSSPVVVPANDTAAIKYRLATDLSSL